MGVGDVHEYGKHVVQRRERAKESGLKESVELKSSSHLVTELGYVEEG